jgi:hypothetical protein
MRVLSIDLDYAMGSYIDRQSSYIINQYEEWDNHPLASWQKMRDLSDIDFDSLEIDLEGIEYMWTSFAKALRNCKDVDFAYEHDAILYRLEKDDAKDLEIINIDHHGDISNLSEFLCYVPDEEDPDDEDAIYDDTIAREKEYEYIRKFDDVMEGNWVAWLDVHEKLKKYITISEDRELQADFNSFEVNNIDGYSGTHSRKNYKIRDFNFDYIFVCLSPTYIPPKHWKYFKFFIESYERLTGNKANIIDRKYEMTARYRSLNKYLGLPV